MDKYKPLANMAFIVGLITLALTPFFYNYQYATLAGLLMGMGAILIGFGLGVYLRSIKAVLFSRKGRRGFNSWINTLLLFGILLAIYLCCYFELLVVRKDLSKERVFSLSPQTLGVLESLDFPIDIKVFDLKSGQNPTHDLLALYQRENDLIQVTYIDTHKYPLLAKQYRVTRRGTYIFTSEHKTPVTLTEDDFVKRTFDDRGRMQLELRQEEKLTSTLYSFMDARESHCYFLTGHGERTIDDYEAEGLSKLKEALSIENIVVTSHNIAIQGAFPQPANVVVIPGPKSKFTEYELKTLRQFIKNKGALLVLLDPLVESRGLEVGLSGLLEEQGFVLHDDLVIDPDNFFKLGDPKSPQGSPLLPVLDYQNHAIVNPLEKRHLDTIFFSARSLEKKTPLADNYEYQPVLLTSKSGYGEVSLQAFKTSPKYDQGRDYKGPVCVGAVMRIRPPQNTPGPETRLAVYGDSGFAANQVVGIGGHKDLLVNTVRWLLNQEKHITIRPKEIKFGEVHLPASEERMALLYFLLLQPGGLLLGDYF